MIAHKTTAYFASTCMYPDSEIHLIRKTPRFYGKQQISAYVRSLASRGWRCASLTSLALELELRLHRVVAAVQQAAVDGERSQLLVQLQLAHIILALAL